MKTGLGVLDGISVLLRVVQNTKYKGVAHDGDKRKYKNDASLVGTLIDFSMKSI